MPINLFLPSTKVSTISKIYDLSHLPFLFLFCSVLSILLLWLNRPTKKIVFSLQLLFLAWNYNHVRFLRKKKSCEVSCFTLPKATAESWQGLCKLLEYPGVSTSQHPLLILWELLLGNCWPIQTHNCIHPSSMSPSNEAILVYNWHGLSSFSHPLLLFSF